MKSLSSKNLKNNLPEVILNSDYCPLCSLVMDFEFDFLAKLQYEVANEESIRREIAREGGFCDFHFRQFKKIAGGKTNILLLKTIIDEKYYEENALEIHCRVCKAVNEFENNLIDNFVKFLSEKENRIKFDSTNGICSVHLQLSLNKISDNNIKIWLQNSYTKQIERMQKDFDEMINHNSFYEIDREKRKLINILIEKLAGRKTSGL